MDDTNSKKWFIAPCGLDCSECLILLRSEEVLEYWRQKNVDPEKIRCDGCRIAAADRHWSPQCGILRCCVREKKLFFCAECADFPCPLIESWAGESATHRKAVRRLAEIRAVGYDAWRRKGRGED